MSYLIAIVSFCIQFVIDVQQLRIILVFVGFCRASKCFKEANTFIKEDQTWQVGGKIDSIAYFSVLNSSFCL